MREAVLHLSCIPGVGPATIIHLYNTLGPSRLYDIYRMCSSDIHACGVNWHIAHTICHGLRYMSYRDNELRAITQFGAQYVTIADSAYPSFLWHIPTPPPVIYYYGSSLHCLDACIACVGSRKADHYARRAAQHIIPDVVQHGYTIVSGGAYGADTIAHKVALQHNGITAAVIGAGLGYLYPRNNRRLFQEICAYGGLVISPFSMYTRAHAYNFPVRNRVIAGLSRAVIVLQAARNSGTNITAAYALEAGRDVGAVPGCIDDPRSEGVHALIQQGASLITSGADAIRMCGDTYQPDHRCIDNMEFKDPLIDLCRTPQQFDTLLAHTGMEFTELQRRLMDLQLDGKLTQDISGCWCAC